jgi:hypothetical protein
MRWLIALAALGVLASCSHKKDELGEKIATMRGFCNEWGARACNDTVVGLCSAASKDDCAAAQQTFCESLIPEEKYSPLTARDCLGAVEDAYRDGKLTADERDTVTALANQCDRIVSGSLSAGKSCFVDSDCNRDRELSCIKKTSTIGKCEKPADPPVEGGRDCSADEDVCVDGFYCDGENCLAKKTEGDDCSVTVPCDAESHCLDSNGHPVGTGDSVDGGGSMSGICAARKTTGGACASDDDCTSRICSPKAGSTTGVCSAQISLSPSDRICTALQ